jgi:hypothetical protein
MDANSRAVEIEEIYANNGTEMTASTVAVVRGNQLLIGSVASHMLYCEMRQ